MDIVHMQRNEAARIEPLSVIPFFFDLTAKRAVIAGGAAGAAWKAELLAAAGADVHIYAVPEDVSAEMAAFLARTSNARLHARAWDTACLAGASVAVAVAVDEDEAAAFEKAARGAGAACNVIDRPKHCHFQFGTIVNRSPVVVGISTSGASPVLGQAIRRRIETLLPRSLAGWSALMLRLRRRALAQISSAAGRRAFWERFVDRAFGPAPGDDAEAILAEDMNAAANVEAKGIVTFVGAGPGEAELLTLKAVRALQAADVILFDDLVSDEVLELARREAKRILVGKRAGRPSCKQDEINEMMVALARAGRRVVRLKSGDPMIFGRAGEEIAALEAAGLSYEIVPGITAGLAMAAAFGVSLTHRDRARSVRFVTGHSKDGGLPDADWRAIADPATTTIFYMGGRMAREIAARLAESGLSLETPVAVATALGRRDERKALTTLAGLADTAARLDPRAPLLIGIGEVFRPGAAKALSEAPEAPDALAAAC